MRLCSVFVGFFFLFIHLTIITGSPTISLNATEGEETVATQIEKQKVDIEGDNVNITSLKLDSELQEESLVKLEHIDDNFIDQNHVEDEPSDDDVDVDKVRIKKSHNLPQPMRPICVEITPKDPYDEPYLMCKGKTDQYSRPTNAYPTRPSSSYDENDRGGYTSPSYQPQYSSNITPRPSSYHGNSESGYGGYTSPSSLSHGGTPKPQYGQPVSNLIHGFNNYTPRPSNNQYQPTTPPYHNQISETPKTGYHQSMGSHSSYQPSHQFNRPPPNHKQQPTSYGHNSHGSSSQQNYQNAPSYRPPMPMNQYSGSVRSGDNSESEQIGIQHLLAPPHGVQPIYQEQTYQPAFSPPLYGQHPPVNYGYLPPKPCLPQYNSQPVAYQSYSSPTIYQPVSPPPPQPLPLPPQSIPSYAAPIPRYQNIPQMSSYGYSTPIIPQLPPVQNYAIPSSLPTSSSSSSASMPCPQQLLFSCVPHVSPAPCSSQGSNSASYYPPQSLSVPSYTSYQQQQPTSPSYRASKADDEDNNNDDEDENRSSGRAASPITSTTASTPPPTTTTTTTTTIKTRPIVQPGYTMEEGTDRPDSAQTTSSSPFPSFIRNEENTSASNEKPAASDKIRDTSNKKFITMQKLAEMLSKDEYQSTSPNTISPTESNRPSSLFERPQWNKP